MDEFTPLAAELTAVRFAALSDATRIRLVRTLGEQGETSVHELTDAVQGSVANVSKHLQVLFHAELVQRRRDGTRVLYRLADDDVCRICIEMERLFDDRDEQTAAPLPYSGADPSSAGPRGRLTRLRRE